MRHLVGITIALVTTLLCGLRQATVFAQNSTESHSSRPVRHAYYGDLHLHTGYSLDAFLINAASVDPDEAYRFAKGETIEYFGERVRRREPLDFLAVTDHGESLGAFSALEDDKSPVAMSEVGKRIERVRKADSSVRQSESYLEEFSEIVFDFFVGNKNRLSPQLMRESEAAWKRTIDAANHHYQPGAFTTFIGFEWTATPNGANLHRNVIFKGASAPYPFTSLDSKLPEDLWAWLEAIRKTNGFEAIAIPHNANASDGLMYDWLGSSTAPMTRSYARRRQRNEPLSEISQHKGASETHPLLSPNDESASYEIFDFIAPLRRRQGRLEGSYLRDALSRGLALHRQLGSNPFKYGFVGGSDMHGGLSVSAQADAGGKGGGANLGGNRPTRAEAAYMLNEQGALTQRQMTTGSLTGVWAESNTRESIYEALLRREVFATSGSRLQLLLFGGWDFSEEALQKEDWVSAANAQGVPMGGDLPAKPAHVTAPTFVVWAIKDPNGASLDRAQIIKAWEKDGQRLERVFNVARATADSRTGSNRNEYGATELKAVWKDPSFEPGSFAAYYLRVLEIPTPRWSTLLALQAEVTPPKDVPRTVQQRGWSSPIWYTPASASSLAGGSR